MISSRRGQRGSVLWGQLVLTRHRDRGRPTPGPARTVGEHSSVDKNMETDYRAALRLVLSFAGAGEQHGRRRRTRGRDRPTACGSWFALQVVSLGQVEQPPPGERVRILGQIARPLREASVEIFHDATPATSLKGSISLLTGCCVKRAGHTRTDFGAFRLCPRAA